MGLGQGFPASLTPSQGFAGTGREKRRSPRGGSANGIFVNDENEDPPGVFLEKVLVTQRTNSAPIVHGHLFFEIQTKRWYISWDLYFPMSTPVSMATSGLKKGSVLGHINDFRYQHSLLSISQTVFCFSYSVFESLFLSVFHILYSLPEPGARALSRPHTLHISWKGELVAFVYKAIFLEENGRSILPSGFLCPNGRKTSFLN